MENLEQHLARLSEASRRKLLARLLREREKQAGGPFPLSAGQQGLWFIYQLDPESAAYNVALPMRIDSEVDPEALRRTFQILLERHPTLRTVFRASSEETLQQTQPDAEVDFTVVDASRHARSELEEEVRRAYRQPFDLERGPILRVRLYRRRADRWVLLFTVPHIAADAWSIRLLIEEIGQIYPRLLAGSEPAPAQPGPQYRDFVRWQERRLAGAEGEALWAYWRERLDGELPVLELPGDRPRPAVQSFRGASISFRLSSALTARLKELARAEAVTPFVVLLAVYNTLLHRYTGQHDLLVGTPMAGRSRPEFERLVGYFVNLVPLRARPRAGTPFVELLRQLRQTVLGALEHQDYPYEKLVERLAPARDAGRNALFQVLFEFQKKQEGDELVWLTVSEDSAERMTLGGLEIGFFPLAQQEGKFDLQLEMAEKGDRLIGIWKYSAEIFDRSTVERLSGHFERLLESVLEDPSHSLGALELLRAGERQALLGEWNAAADLPLAEPVIHHRFARRVAERPDEVALICDLDELTYRQLDQRANRLARLLVRRGVGPEVPVCLLLERSLEQVVAMLAVLKAGGAYVPLDPRSPAARLESVLDDSRAPLLIAEEASRDLLDALAAGREVLCLETERARIEAESDEPLALAPVPPERLAYVIYTSGSTGKPKGVQVTHRNVCRLFDATAGSFAFGPQDVWTLFHSYAFDFSVWEIWGALLHGGSLVVVPYPVSRSPEAFRDLLRTEGVTVLNQTPSAFYQLIEADAQAGDDELALRLVIFGGEALDLQAIRPWLEAHGERRPRLVNMYGITETTVHVTERRLRLADLDRASSSPIGSALADLRLLLLDRQLQPLPVGCSGEILVGGAGLARGYLRRPALSAERFVPDPFSARPGARLYRSGDLARYRPDGELEYLGRLDDQVKIRGFRIELGEIEAALGRHPQLRQVAVMARPDAVGESALIAYVVAREAGVPTASELRSFAADSLPSYMVPTAFVVLPELPLNANGKLDRRALPEADEISRDRGDELVAPRTATEKRLAALWSEVLRLDEVGASDHFFEVGGHSLHAVRLTSRIRQAFAVELPVQAIFELPCLAELAAHLDGLLGRRPEDGEEPLAAVALAPIERLPRDTALELSFAQERLWFLDRLEGAGSVAYNVPMVLEMRGRLRPAILRAALEQIAQRHETLRTTFSTVAGRPVQRVHDAVQVPMVEVDLRALSAEQCLGRARRIAAGELHRSFDLATGPLWRAVVIRLDDARSWLILTLHHIVSDGWSTGILQRELGALYRACVLGAPAALPELPTQYADYAAWQRRQLAGEERQRLLAYWTRELDRVPAVLQLPTDRPRPAVQTFRGGLIELRLPRKLGDRLRALGRERGTTLFTVLLAAFQALLFRHCGQRDLCVGSPVANRSHPAIEGLIGCFVNTVVLRAELSPTRPFEHFLGRTHERVVGALAHQALPFELLVETLQPSRDLSRNPLFQVLFALLNTPPERLELPDLELEAVMPESEIAKFDLTLSLVDDLDGLIGYLEYNRDLFDRATVVRLKEQLPVLLEGVVRAPQTPLAELPLLPSAEREHLLRWSEGGRVDPASDSLDELILARAAVSCDAIALIDGEARLSYAEMVRRSTALAVRLRGLGIGPESFVGVCVERGAEMVWSLLAVLAAGGAYVPLDPAYPRQRLAFILEDARVSVLLSDRKLVDRLPETGAHTIYLDDEAQQRECLSSAPVREVRDDLPLERLAYLIYTSGSTGRPKGVAIDHRSVAALLGWAERTFSDRDLAGVLASTSICFDLSIFEIFLPLSRGGSVILSPNLLHLPTLPARAEISLINSVPSVTAELLRQHRLPRSVRAVNLAGEPIRRALIDQLYAQPGIERVFNLYGPSEDTTYSTVALLPRHSTAIPAIGRPIAGTRTYLLDEGLELVPQGAPGEICLGGRGVARGYLGRAALTSERFVPDPFSDQPGSRLYRTGDVGRWGNGGELEFLGRRDKQVKVRGFRIELGEIEEALARLPQIEEAAVQVRSRDSEDRQLVAYLVWTQSAAGTVDEVRRHLVRHLPAYMVPTVFVELEELPRTPNGKLDSAALPAAEMRASSTPFAAPESERQHLLAELWREVLGVERVGVDDSFFDLGGHSLLMARLHARLLERLPGTKLSLVDLFQVPTVRALADFLDQNAPARATAELEASRERAAGRRRKLVRRRGRSARVAEPRVAEPRVAEPRVAEPRVLERSAGGPDDV